MTVLESYVQSEFAKALGWTLVHSLWEGAAIALLLAIVLGVARSSRVRYAAGSVAMLALLISFGVTLYRLAPQEIGRPKALQRLPRPANPPADKPADSNARTPWDASELLPWLAPMWLVGVLLFQLRCLISWTAAARLGRRGVCGASPEWVERLDELRARLRMTKPVTLLESCLAEVPVVIGHLRPVILMPVGLLAGLPAAQVEAILLHELAHIRRADYLVNLLQTLIEGLFFYHPAAWWISRSIRTERENCCDDLVVLTNGDAHEYATALAALAENRWAMREAAMAATGGNLVKRIRRLLAQPEGPRMTFAPIFLAGVLVITGAVALVAWETPAPQGPATMLPGWAEPMVIAQAQAAPAEAQVAPSYRKWLLEEVPYIITDQERADFRKLRTDAERERFVEEFWTRRDPTPGTPQNEYKTEHYRRIAYANDRFKSAIPGWKTDRVRIYIEYGPPDEIDSHPSGGAYRTPSDVQTVTYPFEQWRYKFIEGIGKNIIMEFVDKGKMGEFRLTMDPAEKEIRHANENEQAENLRHAVERQLRDLKNTIPPHQIAMLESQAQVEQGQKQLEKLQVEMRDAEDRSSPAEAKLLEWQAHIEQAENLTRERQLRVLTDQLAKADHIALFGSGSQVMVAVLPNRTLLVTIPFDFPAEQYRISVSTVSADGTTVWSDHGEANRGNSNSLTMAAPTLAPGSYKLTAGVKDPDSSKEKTYVVNFSVK